MKNLGYYLVLIIQFIGLSDNWGQSVQFQESALVQTMIKSYENRMKATQELPGYRVLYFFTNDRREMEVVEKRFKEKYDFLPHNWIHDQPYYNLYAGSFLSKYKAMALLSRLRADFPAAVLVNAKVTVKDIYDSRQKIVHLE